MEKRFAELRGLIGDMGKVAVAYSGGVDSTLLLKIARDELGNNAGAIICSGDLMPSGEVEAALLTARSIGVEAAVVRVDLSSVPEVTENHPDRCYHCKRAVFRGIIDRAWVMGIDSVVDGTHRGDRDDDRPGMRALRELGVRSPLAEAGMDKEDIREASRKLGLPTADRPASPCLATRIPFYEPITPEKLSQVDRAESLLKNRGYRLVRVRHHGDIARIELEAAELSRAVEEREAITAGLVDLGFTYVALDLKGFRSGSMSEALKGR
ncbi:MAG: ATP-dependent sacrificial sulfur transferase LarE [Methanomassiliicoccus sp.]|nr:ATP-dependent sacrificial sulfur transferase LarE [Methanomassiliicoccus sp.]